MSATAAAEAAGLSRVTPHRIEHGEPSVTMGAYVNVIAALGLTLPLPMPVAHPAAPAQKHQPGWVPARVVLKDHPQLAQLAWQVQGLDALTPQEAWRIYLRNERHLDPAKLSDAERDLIDAHLETLHYFAVVTLIVVIKSGKDMAVMPLAIYGNVYTSYIQS